VQEQFFEGAIGGDGISSLSSSSLSLSNKDTIQSVAAAATKGNVIPGGPRSQLRSACTNQLLLRPDDGNSDGDSDGDSILNGTNADANADTNTPARRETMSRNESPWK